MGTGGIAHEKPDEEEEKGAEEKCFKKTPPIT